MVIHDIVFSVLIVTVCSCCEFNSDQTKWSDALTAINVCLNFIAGSTNLSFMNPWTTCTKNVKKIKTITFFCYHEDKGMFHHSFKHLLSLFVLIKLHYFLWCPHVWKINPSSSSQSHSSSSLKGLSSLGGSWNLMFASMSLITTMRRFTSWFNSRPAWATSPSSSLGSSFTTEQVAADECVL